MVNVLFFVLHNFLYEFYFILFYVIYNELLVLWNFSEFRLSHTIAFLRNVGNHNIGDCSLSLFSYQESLRGLHWPILHLSEAGNFFAKFLFLYSV